jgi:oligoribonuclease
MARPTRLVWIDLEMTGLDPDHCVIVEIATIVTEDDLTVVAEGPNLTIHQPEEALAAMEPVVVEMHTKSGLIERIRQSDVTLAQASKETRDFIAEHTDPKTAPLCGNSVWKDKQFLEKYMREVSDLLHYRIVDVSTLKELVRRWYPPSLRAPRKREVHRALDDIRESIEELRWYREKILTIPTAPPA